MKDLKKRILGKDIINLDCIGLGIPGRVIEIYKDEMGGICITYVLGTVSERKI